MVEKSHFDPRLEEWGIFKQVLKGIAHMRGGILWKSKTK
jgi:hypothetical protein